MKYYLTFHNIIVPIQYLKVHVVQQKSENDVNRAMNSYDLIIVYEFEELAKLNHKMDSLAFVLYVSSNTQTVNEDWDIVALKRTLSESCLWLIRKVLNYRVMLTKVS